MERYEEGVRRFSERTRKWREEDRKRNKEFCDILIPLLREEVIKVIVEDGRATHQWMKEAGERQRPNDSLEIPDDDKLLREHLAHQIYEYDRNYSVVEKEELPAFAEILNENPFASFFTLD